MRGFSTAGRLSVEKGGVATAPSSAAEERVEHSGQPIPDVLAYLQNETELTRSTLVRILRESGRLGELFNNPQHFLDAVAGILKHELHRLLVDGIKYERVGGSGAKAEWEMLLFKNEELVNYLSALPVQSSVYELSLIHISEPTRLGMISYAVFCLKKKKKKKKKTNKEKKKKKTKKKKKNKNKKQ